MINNSNILYRVGAALVFVLETMWVAALFVDLLCRRGQYTLSLRCWDFTRWSCGRARAPFYACAATSILFANLTVLAAVSGKGMYKNRCGILDKNCCPRLLKSAINLSLPSDSLSLDYPMFQRIKTQIT